MGEGPTPEQLAQLRAQLIVHMRLRIDAIIKSINPRLSLRAFFLGGTALSATPDSRMTRWFAHWAMRGWR